MSLHSNYDTITMTVVEQIFNYASIQKHGKTEQTQPRRRLEKPPKKGPEVLKRGKTSHYEVPKG